MGLLDKITNALNTSGITKTAQRKTAEDYSFHSVEEIQNIPIPHYQKLNGIESPIYNIEYILHRKATEYKKTGQKEMALACLRKANEIFPHSNFSWKKKDYMRIVEFLKDFGDFDEARKEEQFILDNYSKYFSESIRPSNQNNDSAIDDFMKQWKSIHYKDGSDLVSTEGTARGCTCEECTKYRGRIFSVYGKDSRFPKLPDILRKMYIHKECDISFAPIIFMKGNNNFFNPSYDPTITLNTSAQIIKYVNRPFIDDRSDDEKVFFEDNLQKKRQEAQDRRDYDWIREFLPDDAPKSFGGYRKMKNSNSPNYQKLISLAEEKGYSIK